MRVQVKLSPEELKEIVLQHLTTKCKVVSDVKFEVGKEYRGVGRSESEVIVFKGVTCDIEI